MGFKNFLEFGRKNKLIVFLIIFSFLSSLKILLLPISGDEITYSKIAESIIFHGEYALNGKPSTITPSIPFIIAFLYTKFNPAVGFILAKLLNFLFLFLGLKYCFLFLKKKLPEQIISIILLLTIVNNNFVVWSIRLYPEPLLFCFFWMFMYFIVKKTASPKDILYLMVSFSILVLTRYLYAVLGVLVVYKIFIFLKELKYENNTHAIKKVVAYSTLAVLPLLFWAKYTYHLEKEIDTGLSYFNRFKNNDIFYNIKAGLGLIQHTEVDNINGIPAFITVFLPITGFRSWILSILLIISFCLGFFSRWKNPPYRNLFIAILLVMGGLVFAGTGFSRYWLLMLPGYLLGFYLFSKQLKLDDKVFLITAKIVAVIYVINEIRLDILILNKL